MSGPYDDESGITVGELIRQLSMSDPNDPVCFGYHGHFKFYRVKDRSGCTQIEFNEAEGVDYVLLPEHHYMKHLKETKRQREGK